jgi:beta-lactamase class A
MSRYAIVVVAAATAVTAAASAERIAESTAAPASPPAEVNALSWSVLAASPPPAEPLGAPAGRSRRPVILAPAPEGVAVGRVVAAVTPGARAALVVDGRVEETTTNTRSGRVAFVIPTAGARSLVVRAGGQESEPVHAWLLSGRHEDAGGPLAEVRRDAALEHALRRATAGARTVGALVVDLAGNRGAAVNAGARFVAASTLKIAVAAVSASRFGVVPGSPRYDVMRRMLVVSDNDATNDLIRELGGPGAVDEALDALGLSGTDLLDYYAALHPTVERDPDVTSMRRTTAWDLAQIHLDVYRRALGAGSPAMQRLLPGGAGMVAAQRIVGLMLANADRTRAAAGWPDVPAAHKSGWVLSANADAGIWFGPRGPVLIAALVDSADPTPLRRVAAVARARYGARPDGQMAWSADGGPAARP